MKVLHLIQSAGLGGIRTLVRDLVDLRARRDGLRPAVLFAQQDAPPPAHCVATGAAIHGTGLTRAFSVLTESLWIHRSREL